MSSNTTLPDRDGPLPKILGSDTELGNVLIDAEDTRHSAGLRAAWALLHAVNGISSRRAWTDRVELPANPQDVGRKYLKSNGSCCYIDLEHFEICTPETTGARDFVAAWQAMLRISQDALAQANAGLPDGARVEATVNNSDGNGSSWGGHLSVLINRGLFDALCVRPSFVPFGYLASFQISSIVYAGAGKVGSENARPAVPFQIAQRADFVETLFGWQTTHRRPLINTRNEALCGPPGNDSAQMARLHVIFYDSNLAPVATYLKAGVLQLVLALLEAGRVSGRNHIKYPLRALMDFSHDPDLRARAELMDGRKVTAVEHQMLILEDVQAFVASGAADAWVPDAGHIVDLWQDTLVKLQGRCWSDLSGRLDWVTRRLVIDSVISRNGIDWQSAQAKHLDLLYANLDPSQGLHWALARDGLIEALHPTADPERFLSNPPDDTRAWTRTMLLRRAGAAAIDQVDWDRVRLRFPDPADGFQTVILDDPNAFTRADCEAIFASRPELAALVAELRHCGAGAAPREAIETTARDVALWTSIH